MHRKSHCAQEYLTHIGGVPQWGQGVDIDPLDRSDYQFLSLQIQRKSEISVIADIFY